ncbi:MAG: hypothetical protein HFJ09_06690 [Lachnospiraceae bacterium]|nr:hypothetical protein [Lachnospiraceae bacterium]
MFQKKDYVVTSAQGVCIVADTPKLCVGKEQQMQYYLLQSIIDKKKRSYIPAENHETVVRAVMTKGEALQLRDFIKENRKEILENAPDKELAREWLESVIPENWCRAVIWLNQHTVTLPVEVLEYLTKANNNLLQELRYIFQNEEGVINILQVNSQFF